MRAKSRANRQANFLYPDLLDQLNPTHPLLKLANNIPWQRFEDEFSHLYSQAGRPAKPIRLMCKQVGMVGVGAWPWTEPRSWAVLMGRNRIREKLFKQEKVLMAEVAFLFGRAEAIDKIEDDRFGAPRPHLWPRRGTGQGPGRCRGV